MTCAARRPPLPEAAVPAVQHQFKVAVTDHSNDELALEPTLMLASAVAWCRASHMLSARHLLQTALAIAMPARDCRGCRRDAREVRHRTGQARALDRTQKCIQASGSGVLLRVVSVQIGLPQCRWHQCAPFRARRIAAPAAPAGACWPRPSACPIHHAFSGLKCCYQAFLHAVRLVRFFTIRCA